MSPINLDDISIAAPCSANWNEMAGDERSRACSLCKKNVYNISAMSRSEAQALIAEKEGKICIRLFKRSDGTVIVDNCPVGLRAIRNRLRWVGAGVAAALTFLGGVALASMSGTPNPSPLPAGISGGAQSGGTLKKWLFPIKEAPVYPMMGSPCVRVYQRTYVVPPTGAGK